MTTKRITIDGEIYKELDKLAEELGRSTRGIAEDAILNYIFLLRKHLKKMKETV